MARPSQAIKVADLVLKFVRAGARCSNRCPDLADRQVNQTTGAIRLAGLFPNPGNILRPGQYGRVRTSTRTHLGALLVPQRTVTELQGTHQVAVVDSENKINIRTVKVGERTGRMWIIDEGLKPGERVGAEGVQKVGPGMPVKPLPFADG